MVADHIGETGHVDLAFGVGAIEDDQDGVVAGSHLEDVVQMATADGGEFRRGVKMPFLAAETREHHKSAEN